MLPNGDYDGKHNDATGALMKNPYGKKKQVSDTPDMAEANAQKTASPDRGAQQVSEQQPVGRQMTAKRRFTYALLKPLAWLLVNFIWLSCRVKVIGQANTDTILAAKKPVIPCYWHQQHLFCGWYMLQQLKCGMKVGFLISPSVDGEIPARIVASKGARVIRGSSTRTGAQALREMYQIIAKDGVSPVTTSDGPTGPIFKFKPGAAMLSRMTGAPMLPLACAADNAWYLGSWDRFMIPKPFSQVVVAIGEPVYVDATLSAKDLSPVQAQMEDAINAMMIEAKRNLS